MDSIDSLIESYSSEAGFDSSGSLTLDRRDQARKLAERWGVTKLNCLLFGVQAAHAMRCSRLDLKLQPESWEIVFHLTAESGGAARALERILGNESAPSLELFRRLYLAALSCAQEVHWMEDADELKLRLDFRRVSIIALLRQKLLGEELRDLGKSLRERCSLAFIPIYLNGKLVNSGSPEDCPVLGLNISYLSFQPAYWDNGPWIAEKLQLTDNQDPESFIVTNRAIRASEGCALNGVNCDVPPDPEAGWDRLEGRTASCVTFLESTCAAQLETFEWRKDKHYFRFQPDKDLFHSTLKLNEHFVLGTRTCSLGARDAGKVHNLVVVANGLASSLSPISHVIPPRGEKILSIHVPSMCVKHWVALRGSAPPTSWLLYVKHGVFLDPVSLETTPFPTSAIRADNSVQTDYSGLRVVANDCLQADIDWVRDSAQQLLSRLAVFKKQRRRPLAYRFTQAFQDSMQRALKINKP